MNWFQLVIAVEDDQVDDAREWLKTIRDGFAPNSKLDFEEQLQDFSHPTQMFDYEEV